MQGSENKDEEKERKKEIKRLKRVFGTVYFVQGMSGLPELSIFYYMMNVLKMGPVAGQIFDGLRYIAWFIKPLWGFISDKYPIFGYKRKSYFVLMAASAFLSWGFVAVLAYLNIKSVLPYFILFNLAATSYAFVDVVVDALMVEHGRKLEKESSFVNFQWLALGFAGVIVALTSGWFQQKIEDGALSYWMIFGLTGIFPFFTAYVGIKNIYEERIKKIRSESFKTKIEEKQNQFKKKTAALLNKEIKWNNLKEKIDFGWRCFKNWKQINRYLWLLGLFIIFWNFSPSVGYVNRMYLVEELKFTPIIFGIITAVRNIAWLISIVVFQWFIKKYPNIQWTKYLYAMIVLGTVSLASGFYYYLPTNHSLSFSFSFPWSSILGTINPIKDAVILNKVYDLVENLSQWNRYHWWALGTGTLLDFASIPAFLIPLTIVAKTISIKKVGMIYAIFMSISNATNSIEKVAGGKLYQLFAWKEMSGFLKFFENSWLNIAGTSDTRVLILQNFVYISFIFTLLVIPFVTLLSRELKKRNIKVELGK